MALATESRSTSGSHRRRGRKRGRQHGKRRGFIRRFWWLWLTLILLPILAAGIGFGILVSMYAKVQIPEFPELQQTSYVYYQDGNREKLLTSFHAAVDRTEVKEIGEVSQVMQDAIVSAEDKTFWTHSGVDPKGIIRAAWADIRNQALTQGGSTITQQLVKNLFTGGERTMERKINEALLAIKIERDPVAALGLPEDACLPVEEGPCRAAKEEILRRYLNTIYFGHGAYGIEAAAETYFGVRARQLTLSQAATLAGVVAAPSDYDPISHPKDAQDRRNYVLGRMVIDQVITQDEADAAKKKSVKKSLNPPDQSLTSYDGDYFALYVRQELERQFGEEDVTTGGLRAYTTLDMGMQRTAQKVVEHYFNPGTDKDPDAALVAIDPRSGEILAMYGGAGIEDTQFNLATQAYRQAGSAFKPFTLAAAYEAEYDPKGMWNGPQVVSIRDEQCEGAGGEPWRPANAADGESGTWSLEDATAYSVNTVFAQLVVEKNIGPENVAKTAHRMGIESELDPVCSITLGTQLVSPLEMTSAYATLANRGSYVPPSAIRKVRGADEPCSRVCVAEAPRRQAITAQNADLVTAALEGVIGKGTGVAAALDGIPAAGKTGTTQEYKDAWFCGYTPKLAACVWVGYRKHERSMATEFAGGPVFGGTYPAQIWHDFMSAVYQEKGWEAEDFTNPDYSHHNRHGGPETGEPTESPAPDTTESPAPTDDTERNRDEEPTDEPSPPADDGGGGGGGGGDPDPDPDIDPG